MSKNKRITALAVVLVLAVLFAGIGGTYAYLTRQRRTVNEITIGKDTIDIPEEYDPPKKLEPESVYKKKVVIRNQEGVPCYVRVRLEFSDRDIEDISEFSSNGKDGPYYSASPTAADPYITHLPENWVYDPTDGYYYYTEVLPEDEKTTPLIEYVKTTFESEEDIEEYEIIVYAESIQWKDINGKLFEDDDTQKAYQKAWTEYINRR